MTRAQIVYRFLCMPCQTDIPCRTRTRLVPSTCQWMPTPCTGLSGGCRLAARCRISTGTPTTSNSNMASSPPPRQPHSASTLPISLHCSRTRLSARLRPGLRTTACSTSTCSISWRPRRRQDRPYHQGLHSTLVWHSSLSCLCNLARQPSLLMTNQCLAGPHSLHGLGRHREDGAAVVASRRPDESHRLQPLQLELREGRCVHGRRLHWAGRR
mmetsp:Transcript_9584/g.23137  ORF Transcript_9584/g.23137 Transcript_9584/m.23137 type:complete len:213 (-) Transcript_9584:1194-1832(-)